MEYELIRQLVLEELRNQLENLETGRSQVNLQARSILLQVGYIACTRQLWCPDEAPTHDLRYVGDQLPKDDKDTVKTILWQLIVQGVLVPGQAGDEQGNWPLFTITEYGKTFLKAEGSAPYDPDGYLRCIKNDSPDIDKTVLVSLTEGLQCFLKGHYLACAVMVGVAAEKVILDLIDAFAGAISSDHGKASEFKNRTQNKMISTQFKELTKRLYPLENQLPAELGKDLETYLDGIFNLIRNYRNEAGHPTGREIPRELAYSNLQLFRYFSKNAHDLIGYLRNNQI
jgi:hypothetical protein